MKSLAIALALFCALPHTAAACSLFVSPEFRFRRAKPSSPVPPKVVVRSVDFMPSMGDADSCDGVGFIAIELEFAGLSDRKAHDFGFFVRAVSGVHDEGVVPAFPMAAVSSVHGKASVHWAWTGITPDPDGHVRWRLEIVPVSRSGVAGEPVAVCAATDDSCPKTHEN
ncbi:MAG: hypothetical protein KA144_08545 [Xanthomonadaceae bacterium]|nr:hypothetical protein [Xanthomonadaceae bacterium]